MVWTGGVAIALTVGRAIKHLSTSAWNRTVPYNPQEMVLGPIDFITAFVYGTCATLFLFAVVSKDFWKSPGKISLMIFTLICLIDWGLSTFAYTMIVQNVEVVEEMLYDGNDHVIVIEGVSRSDWVTPNFEILMVSALVGDLVRKHKVDGWTMTVCTGLPLMSFIRLLG